MATKKYFTDESLSAFIDEIKAGDAESLSSAKNYTDTEVAKKANSSHTHDDRYYTESEIDTKISAVNTSIENITSGTTTVKKAEQATTATTASNAEKLGGQLPSYYAKASDIPTGALADKDVVSESDLDNALAEKVNAAAEGNHSHSNKTVLDGITSTKVSAWDSAEANAKAYADSAANAAANTVKNDLLNGAGAAYDTLKELGDLIVDNKDAIDALEEIASGKANATHIHAISDVTGLQTALDEKATIEALTNAINEAKENASNKDAVVLSEAQKNIDAVQTNLDTHIADTTVHITSTERTNWNAAKTHADLTHAPSNAQANVIESIKVNGTAQTITSKSVNITVPTKTSDLTHDSGFLVASDIANKANKATTLSGYGITDAYTKSEVDAKTAVDSALSSSSTKPVQNKVVNSAINTLTSAVSANTSSISAHSTAISNLQTTVNEFEEITSDEIQNLFRGGSTPAGYDVEITNSGAGNWGNSINITYTDATGTHTKSSSGETLTGVTYLKVNSINYAGYDGTLTCNEYTETELKAGVTLTKNISIDIFSSCFVEGTLITMADGTTKAVENIEEGDEVLSWDFDKGEMSTGKVFWVAEPNQAPCYWDINLSDGTNVKLVGANNKSHRLFSVDNGRFMYPQDFEGEVFKEDASRPTLANVEKVYDNVKYYNFANTNLNCFANGVMAGCRFSNVYPIENMQFVKDNRELLPVEEFEGIPAKYIDGLRLREQRLDGDVESVKYYNTVKEHVIHNYIEHEKGYEGAKDYKQWAFKQ